MKKTRPAKTSRGTLPEEQYKHHYDECQIDQEEFERRGRIFSAYISRLVDQLGFDEVNLHYKRRKQ